MRRARREGVKGMPRLLELCCGSKSVSKYFGAQGWECITLDIDAKLDPTIVADVRDIDPPTHLEGRWCGVRLRANSSLLRGRGHHGTSEQPTGLWWFAGTS